MIALYIIHADGTQLVQNVLAFHVLGDGLETHGTAHLVNRPDGFEINLVRENMAYEGAINLAEIKRQIFQIRERTEPSAEINQRKMAAHAAQYRDQMRRQAEIGQCRGFGYLE